VGWYGAAYKPITAVLAIPLTYYIGLFPTLSRTFQQDRAQFEGIIIRSLRLASVVALPIGVGGTFLAGPIVQVLFGDSYANSIGPVQILSWSAVIVILRGTLRQSLNAAGRQDLDLRCAGASIILNVSMNMLLIPQYGILGAAVATVVAETLWLLSASYYLHRSVVAVTLLPSLWRPLLAASLMATYLFATRPLPWLIQSMTSVVVYFVVLWLLGEPEVKSLLLRTRQVHVPWTG
jgi:O-antigen/teichoic acid export membrane protein